MVLSPRESGTRVASAVWNPNALRDDEPDSVVEPFDASAGESVFDCDEDPGATGADGSCEIGERGEPAALRPRAPAVEQLDADLSGVEVAGEDRPECCSSPEPGSNKPTCHRFVQQTPSARNTRSGNCGVRIGHVTPADSVGVSLDQPNPSYIARREGAPNPRGNRQGAPCAR